VPRNRKRAKERRARRPRESRVGRPGIAAARGEGLPGPAEHGEQTPSPIEHAAPDVELADAQLAIGRPGPVDDSPEAEAELEAELELEEAESERNGAGAPVAEVASHRVGVLARLIGFLQGSWRELQRVQWPDRRQVVQATGVVIGFVIVAGLYLALADTVASKLMTYILK
jgi:preprotein translocase SecE subunit